MFARGRNDEPVIHDKMEYPSFVEGHLQIMSQETDPEIRHLMHDYLQDTCADVLDHGWEVVRSCHKIILTRMECGKLSWRDVEGIRVLRMRYVWATPKSSGKNSAGGKRNLLCWAFNNGTCTEKGDHQGTKPGVQFKHLCTECDKVNIYARHAAIHCEKRPKNGKGVLPSKDGGPRA